MDAVRATEPESLEDRCDRYASLIEGAPYNLMSSRGLAELRTRHIPECRTFATMLPAGPARVLDLGSGAGLPGMVIALARPDLEIHLLEATAKKARFLEHVCLELGVPVAVHAQRAEDFARGPNAGSFDVVTARAVAALPRLVVWSMPLLKTGGLLLAIKGDRWRDELDEAATAIERCRASVVATPDDQISTGSMDPRVVIIARGLEST